MRIQRVLDHGQLQRLPDLRGREADPGGVPHGLPHLLDEAHERRVAQLLGGERTAGLPQHRVSGLDDG